MDSMDYSASLCVFRTCIFEKLNRRYSLYDLSGLFEISGVTGRFQLFKRDDVVGFSLFHDGGIHFAGVAETDVGGQMRLKVGG